jgi:hypothetical protein
MADLRLDGGISAAIPDAVTAISSAVVGDAASTHTRKA